MLAALAYARRTSTRWPSTSCSKTQPRFDFTKGWGVSESGQSHTDHGEGEASPLPSTSHPGRLARRLANDHVSDCPLVVMRQSTHKGFLLSHRDKAI